MPARNSCHHPNLTTVLWPKAGNQGTKFFTAPLRANQPSCNETQEFILAFPTQWCQCTLVVGLKGLGKNKTHPVAVMVITECWQGKNNAIIWEEQKEKAPSILAAPDWTEVSHNYE